MRSHLIASSMLVLVTAGLCTHVAMASDGGQNAASSSYKLRMCEIADCSVPLASEPYEWVTKDGRVLNSGITDDKGYAAVSQAPGISDYALENINARWDMRVERQCWSKNLEACAKLIKTTQHDGFDDAQSVAARQKEKTLQESQEQQVQSDRLERYHKTAVANDDELAWLGKLPPEWSKEEFQKRLDAVYERMKGDLDHFDDSYQTVLSFECKAPGQFGPVPDAAAVTSYVKSQRAGVSDEEQQRAWDGLVDAGKQGNWQARQFIYFELDTEINVRHNGNLALAWRWLQLKEWLQALKAGVLYGKYIDDVMATGMDGHSSDVNPAYVFAALHGSYSYMLKVGKALPTDDKDFDVPQTDPQYKEKLQQFHKFQAVAKSMRECPHLMMPEMFPSSSGR